MTPSPDPDLLTSAASGALPWGSVFADRMLTATWSAAAGWTPATVRPYSTLPLYPSASVFHYGLSAFDALKVFATPSGPTLFRPDLHLTRLNNSLQRLTLPKLPAPFLPTLLSYVHAVRQWVPTLPNSSLYLRIACFATQARLGVKPAANALLVVMACPVGPMFPRPLTSPQNGLHLRADPRFTRAAPGGLGACKASANYAASMMPAKQAAADGFDQILWLSDATRRHITEAGMMNIFFVYDGTPSINESQNEDVQLAKCTLVTPRLDGTFLDGVTRRSVLHLATDMGIHTEERDLPLDSILGDIRSGAIVEAFGTGTAAIVAPIASIECEGQRVSLAAAEREGNLGLLLRRKLAAIQSAGTHPWMVAVDDAGQSERAPLLQTEKTLTAEELSGKV